MKLLKQRCVLILFALLLAAVPAMAQGQLSQKVSVELTGVTLHDVLLSIEKQVDFKFMVGSADAASVNVPSVNMKDATVKEVLDAVLEGSDLEYDLKNGVIVLKRRAVVKPQEEPEVEVAPEVEEKERVKRDGKTIEPVLNPVGRRITVNGHVQDVAGLSLPGATIIQSGSNNNATVADDAGDFTITVPEDATIELILFGMKTEVVAVNGRTKINVTLKEDAIAIDEVIVTGYGSITKEAYTGSAVTVTSKSLEDRPIGSIDEAFRGNVVGALTNASGQPGEKGDLILRGFGSIEGNNQPLYVIDGVAYDLDNVSGSDNTASNALATLNPADIESVTVLKDAASASLYGSRGANGVVVITTKSGKAGDKMRIDLNLQAGFAYMTDMPDMVNGREYADLWVEGQMHSLINNYTGERSRLVEELKGLYGNKSGYKFEGKNWYEWRKLAQDAFNTKYMMPTPNGGYRKYDYFGDDYDKLPDTKWFDEITRLAPFVNTSVSMRGGLQALSYYASMEYYNQQGTVINSELERYTLRMRLRQDAESRFFSWGLSAYMAYINQTGPNVGGSLYAAPTYAATLLPAVVPSRLEDGSYNFAFPDNLLNGTHNPLANAYENINQRPQVSVTVSGDFTFRFTDWLSFTSKNSIYYYNFRRRVYNDKDFGSGLLVDGQLLERNVHRRKLVSTNTLLANKSWRNGHTLSAAMAFEAEDLKYENVSLTVGGLGQDDYPYVSNASNVSSFSGDGYEYGMCSVVAKADYNYKSRYLVGASYRMDWSSRFAPEYRLGNFWSLSGGWDIAKERFMARSRRYVSQLKIKGSYGINGNQPNQMTYWQDLYNSVRYNNEHGVISNYRYRPELTWEGNEIWNVGIDGTFFNNRLDVGIEYYERKSSNLLEWKKTSASSGYNQMLINNDKAGIMNRGIEFTAKYNVINRGRWIWDLSLNLAKFSSKYYGLDLEYLTGSQIVANGLNVHTWYVRETAGIDPDTGSLLYVNYEKDTGKRYLSTSTAEAPYTTDKQGVPKISGGITSHLVWHRFELDILFTYGLGHWLRSNTGVNDGGNNNGVASIQLDRWTPDHVNATAPMRINSSVGVDGNVTRFLYRGDYLKIKNIKFRYRVNKELYRKWGMDFAAIGFQVENPYVFCSVPDYDPETSVSGYRHSDRYPTSTTYTMSLYIRF